MTNPDYKQKILVEGKNDFHVVSKLLEKNNPEWKSQLEIQKAEGFEQMCNEISVILKGPGLERIGIIFDADNDPKKRWHQVGNKILEAYKDWNQIPCPELKKKLHGGPTQGGMWIDSKPKIGLWMMPNNKGKGAIEDFLAGMVPSKDYRWEHAKNYVQTVLKATKASASREIFPKTKTSKANIYAWLAVQKEPGYPPGLAIRSKYLDAEIPKTQPFREWLEKSLP